MDGCSEECSDSLVWSCTFGIITQPQYRDFPAMLDSLSSLIKQLGLFRALLILWGLASQLAAPAYMGRLTRGCHLHTQTHTHTRQGHTKYGGGCPPDLQGCPKATAHRQICPQEAATWVAGSSGGLACSCKSSNALYSDE